MSEEQSAHLLANAESALEDGKPSMALALLHSVPAEIKEAPAFRRHYLQLQAVCRIQLAHTSTLHSSPSPWWSVLGLDGDEVSDLRDIKRHFKRMAVLVHPDRCSLSCAGEAFALLQQGCETLVESIDYRHHCQKNDRKRTKTEETTTTGRKFPKHDKDDFFNSEDDEEVLAGDENEYAWWTKWDDTSVEKQVVDLGNDENEGELGEERKKEESDEDRRALEAMSCDELAAEIRNRQDAMLSAPPPPGKSLQDLRAALLKARSTLNAKLLLARSNAASRENNHNDDDDNITNSTTTASGGFLL